MLALLLMAVSPAHAQERLFYIGVFGSQAMECIDESHSKDAMKMPTDVTFKDSWGIKVRAGMDINEFFSAEAMLEYVHDFKDTDEGKNNRINAIDLFVNGKAILMYSGSFMPYVIAGPGVITAREKISYRDKSYSSVEWGLAMRAGLGTEIFMTPYIALGLELDHVFTLFGDTDHLRYTNLSLGINFYF